MSMGSGCTRSPGPPCLPKWDAGPQWARVPQTIVKKNKKKTKGKTTLVAPAVLVELPEPPAVVIQVLVILRVDGVDLRGARKGRVERHRGAESG